MVNYRNVLRNIGTNILVINACFAGRLLCFGGAKGLLTLIVTLPDVGFGYTSKLSLKK